MTTIRWGIVGCGDVTEVKSGPGFQKASNSSLVAVMRRNGALAKDYAARHGVPKWYDDAEALINDDAVDAVYVATPPSTHKQYTLMAAQAGKPVLVEKPMALDYAECNEMIAACEKADVPLFVAYYRRALPRFVKIKELLDSGQIGEVRAVTVKLFKRPLAELDADALPWRVQPAISGGGIFADMGAHTLDFLDYVLGPLRSVQGYAANQGGLYPAEDIVTGSFVFGSGAQGVGVWCFTSPDEIDETEITGTRGRIRFSSFDTAPFTLETESGSETFAIDNPLHVHQPLTQRIIDELNGGADSPSTGVSGARTTRVMGQLLGNYYGRAS